MAANLICFAEIPVLDLKRATNFYAKVLGAELSVLQFDDWLYAMLPHAEDKAPGCLTPADEDHQPGRIGPLIYLSVNGRLDEAIEAAAQNGGEVLRGKHEIGPYGYRAIIVDCEGNRIALHSQTA
jgi:hypothetical protein